jgi:hypothetical protein
VEISGHAVNVRDQQAILFAGIDRMHEALSRVRPEGIEMKTLSHTVDATIGAPAAMDGDGLLKDAGKAALQFTLDGATGILDLPTFVIGAVEGDPD